MYLDVEAGTVPSTDYWAGGATTVFNYLLAGANPFRPSIYCQYTQSSGKYVPNSLVQNLLNGSYSTYPEPTYHTRCYSFWTNEPEDPCMNYCGTAPCLDWTLFGTYTQPYGGDNFLVPLQVWQFAETNVCQSCSGISNFAGGQNLDMDDTDNTDGPSSMLQIT